MPIKDHSYKARLAQSHAQRQANIAKFFRAEQEAADAKLLKAYSDHAQGGALFAAAMVILTVVLPVVALVAWVVSHGH